MPHSDFSVPSLDATHPLELRSGPIPRSFKWDGTVFNAVKYAIRILLFSCPLSWSADAQVVQHGTHFVAALNADFAAVAIDSRQSTGVVTNDRYCKIVPLSRNAFFFARGITSAIDNTTHASIYDAREIARQAYREFGIGTTRLDELSQLWARRMVEVYNTKPTEFGSNAVGGVMAEGVFVGVGADGMIAYGSRIIRYAQRTVAPFEIGQGPDDALPRDASQSAIYPGGYRELIEEFLSGGQTERAKKATAHLGPFRPGPDFAAAKVEVYVTAVRNWSGDRGIGGEIAVIVLERGQDLRWVKRPDFCPEI